ncbi:MAG: phage antirepressor N-terminal domain-containing protein [Bilophila wadsworthia]|uniref:phage antirepressor N-terminal domain-containing protein n=1 Tax=Bilophila wadsworthia TaxID=35833 RepID=UPI00300EFBCE
MAKATLSPVQFHGSTIFVVTHKGEPYAPIKPIVEDMGLNGNHNKPSSIRKQGTMG